MKRSLKMFFAALFVMSMFSLGSCNRWSDCFCEVILSGGDPLSLSDRVLNELIGAIGAISHLKRLRFHTRFPIGIPERIRTDHS